LNPGHVNRLAVQVLQIEQLDMGGPPFVEAPLGLVGVPFNGRLAVHPFVILHAPWLLLTIFAEHSAFISVAAFFL
jgi:hypothetical protein